MAKRSIKQRLRRVLHRRQRQVEGMTEVADQQLEKHFLHRLGRLIEVRRFIIGWLSLIVLLGAGILVQMQGLRSTYQSVQPAGGGTFVEGIVGSYTNANPLYATGTVDSAVSRLIFDGLFQYDNDNQLVPNLAEKFELDKTETTYTVTLKPDLVWHDGKKITAEDVVFTFQLAQNPDVRSNLLPSWKGIEISATDERTVIFKLPSSYSPFKHSLTTGLLPQHILKDVDPEQLRSADFNSIKPVGAGPFTFDTVEVDKTNPDTSSSRIGLKSFERYHAGKPRLNRYNIHTFNDDKQLEKAFADKNIMAMSGLAVLPDTLTTGEQEELSLALAAQSMVFFKTTQAPLDDKAVRNALVLASDRQAILETINYPLLPSDAPILSGQTGYKDKFAQLTGKSAAAVKILNKAGWKAGADGIRKKKKQVLSFKLYAEANSENTAVTQALQKQWRAIGVDMQVVMQSSQDLQSTIASHNYGALLSAISNGADPDVFAYWHSSQADARSPTRLNFSEYDSPIVDQALVAGRSRSDPGVRSLKYEPFLKQWNEDSPALSLYQPRYLFVVRKPLIGFDISSIVTPSDRYSHVERWMIRETLQ